MRLSPIRVALARGQPYGHEPAGQKATEVTLPNPSPKHGRSVEVLLRKIEPPKGRQENHLRTGVPLTVEGTDFLCQRGSGYGADFRFVEGTYEAGTLGLTLKNWSRFLG
jgi:hypothetical protein